MNPDAELALGRPLDEISALSVNLEGAESSIWQLEGAAHSQAARLQGLAGGVLRVPYQGRSAQLTREVAALFELRDGQFAVDRFELLADAAEICDPKPRGILISAHADPDLVQRAEDAGAVGLLAKPISFRDLARVLKPSSGAAMTRREPRRRLGGRANVLDSMGPGGPAIARPS